MSEEEEVFQPLSREEFEKRRAEIIAANERAKANPPHKESAPGAEPEPAPQG
jgi:hypothetical protein